MNEKYTPHSVFYETKEQQEMVKNFLWHIRHKTGLNFGRIVLKALQEYNINLKNKGE